MQRIKVGWYDYDRKMFKVIPIDTAEVTSLVDDVAVFNGKPVAHSHINGATKMGAVMKDICLNCMWDQH